MSSSSDEVDEKPWWYTYGPYTPEQLERELRDNLNTNDETVIFSRFNSDPLTRACFKLSRETANQLMVVPVNIMERELSKLIEEFAREVPEESRLVYMQIFKDEKRRDLMEEIDTSEKNVLNFQGFIEARPPAYKVDSDNVWFDIAAVNSSENMPFFGRVVYHEKHACFSVEEGVLDEIETYFRSQIDKLRERINIIKFELKQL